MNWYHKQAAQEWWGNLRDDLEFWQEPDYSPVFQRYGITDHKVIDLNGKKVTVFSYNNERWAFDGGSPKPASEWIYDQYDPFKYIALPDFNADFWSDVGDGFVLYHATPESNFDSIRKRGILQQEKTRGLANRGTGAAIFCSSNIDDIAAYGIPIGIDFGAMKRDGYMPTVAPEGPIEDKKAYELLAHKLGVEDFNYDVESGISEETVVVYGNIPPKYLRFQ